MRQTRARSCGWVGRCQCHARRDLGSYVFGFLVVLGCRETRTALLGQEGLQVFFPLSILKSCSAGFGSLPCHLRVCLSVCLSACLNVYRTSRDRTMKTTRICSAQYVIHLGFICCIVHHGFYYTTCCSFSVASYMRRIPDSV